DPAVFPPREVVGGGGAHDPRPDDDRVRGLRHGARIIAPRPAGRAAATSGDASAGARLQERALARDLAAREREEIAAVHLDAPPVGGGPGEAPLRNRAIARHHVAGAVEA